MKERERWMNGTREAALTEYKVAGVAERQGMYNRDWGVKKVETLLFTLQFFGGFCFGLTRLFKSKNIKFFEIFKKVNLFLNFGSVYRNSTLKFLVFFYLSLLGLSKPTSE